MYIGNNLEMQMSRLCDLFWAKEQETKLSSKRNCMKVISQEMP